MNTILFELGTEELPPKTLKTLRNALQANIEKSLSEQNIAFERIKSYAAPRRLAVQVFGVASVTPDKTETKKGPSVKVAFDQTGELTKAGQGFLQGLNATGLNLSKDDLITISDKKGEYIGYEMTHQGEKVDDLLPSLIQKALDELPIAKRMRSGADKHEFVRPVQWVVLMRDGAVIDAIIQGHKTGNQSRGHRYHSPEFFTIDHADNYEELLTSRQVIADFAKRQEKIISQVKALADEVGAVAIVPDELLDEVTALVDLPVALRAGFDERFLDVPQEALISTMQADQKYFCLTDKDGKLKPHFVFISNIDSSDKHAVILGNEKVVRPRLADAEFFFVQDQKRPLIEFADSLKTRVFQEKLGTIWQKSERIACLASFIVASVQAQGDWQGVALADVVRAGELSKADLATTLVGEFAELQGIAGTYYAHKSGEKASVADAIAEQYLPKFSGDKLPASPIGTALALADRLDTLVGIFGIGQAPTGSKDPFSLRRASIGVLRILIDTDLPLSLSALIDKAVAGYDDVLASDTAVQVLDFIHSRYRAMYTEQGVSVDSIQAVQAVSPDSPPDFDKRVRAVQAFRALPQASTLSQNNKRVANILAKADSVGDGVDENLLTEAAEKSLYTAIKSAKDVVTPLQETADYQGVLNTLVSLDVPLTNFFDTVMVNADDERLKHNRLALLKQVRVLFLSVADIGVLQG
ncbi:MAG: glycine--tRNA ligase subunit beta [Moraxella sp.]|nr:glycine--tRNA ligase subunit beta [Moraxella sp.]